MIACIQGTIIRKNKNGHKPLYTVKKKQFKSGINGGMNSDPYFLEVAAKNLKRPYSYFGRDSPLFCV